MPLQLTRDQVDEIVAHARDETPLECCGLVGGRADRGMHVYRARNLDQSRVRYTIHPEDQLRIEREIEDDRGWELLAIYHSHPMSDAYPSPTDVAHAVESGYGEFTRFIIVSLLNPDQPVARCFWLRGGRIKEDPLAIVDTHGPA